MKRMLVETLQVEGIPMVTWAQQDASGCPLVIYIHGLGSDKRGGMELGYNLASRGFFFISIDAAMHGDRLDERIAHTWDQPLPDAIYPFETGLDRFLLMFKIVDQTAKDIITLIDHFSDDPRVDCARVGVAGASMGGFIAYRVAAIESRVQAVVGLISFPMFLQRWKDAIQEASLQPKWSQAMKNAEAQTNKKTIEIRDVDPMEGLKRFAPKPLLMICGDLDLDTPKYYSLQAYEILEPYYREYPENLMVKIHERAIHRVSSEMIADTTDWFDHLLNEAD